MASKTQTHYEKLGLKLSATAEEIKTAWKKLSIANHPDRAPPGKNEEFTAKFQELSNSYNVLSDTARRAKYDEELRKQKITSSSQPSGTPNRPNPPPGPSTSTKPSGSSTRPNTSAQRVPSTPAGPSRPSTSSSGTPRPQAGRVRIDQESKAESSRPASHSVRRPGTPPPAAAAPPPPSRPLHEFAVPFTYATSQPLSGVSSFGSPRPQPQPQQRPNQSAAPSIEDWIGGVPGPSAWPQQASTSSRSQANSSYPTAHPAAKQERPFDTRPDNRPPRPRRNSHDGVTSPPGARRPRPYSGQPNAGGEAETESSDSESTSSSDEGPEPSCFYYPNEDRQHVQLIMPGATQKLEHALTDEDVSFLQLTKLAHRHKVDLVQYPFIQRRDQSYVFKWKKFGYTKVILKR